MLAATTIIPPSMNHALAGGVLLERITFAVEFVMRVVGKRSLSVVD